MGLHEANRRIPMNHSVYWKAIRVLSAAQVEFVILRRLHDANNIFHPEAKCCGLSENIRILQIPSLVSLSVSLSLYPSLSLSLSLSLFLSLSLSVRHTHTQTDGH